MGTMDNETAQIVTEGDAVYNYVNSKGWQEVKQIFTDKIIDLQSIKNLSKGVTATTLAREIATREAAVDILLEIIREVEGKAQQFDGNRNLTKNPEEVIVNY